MIGNFFRVYEDELLYSAIGRNIHLSGYTNYRNYMDILYDNDCVFPAIDFPGHLERIANKLSPMVSYSSDYLLQNHTLFPVYSLFLNQNKKVELTNLLKTEPGMGFRYKAGIKSGKLCKKKVLYYCPLCSSYEYQEYGEAYFHRIHQVEGIVVCEKHKCLLNQYIVPNGSRPGERMYLNEKYISFKANYLEDEPLLNALIRITNEIEYLLNNCYDNMSIEKIHHFYHRMLMSRGYITNSGTIRQSELSEDLSKAYDEKLLNLLDSVLSNSGKSNWLNILVRENKRLRHPIKHILLIMFLSNSIESFFDEAESLIDKDTEATKYPCLNPVCSNYQKLVVSNIRTVQYHRDQDPIGIFCCDCGFEYSRKMSGDIYKVGRIRNVGKVWENKLVELILSGISINKICDEMNCGYGMIIRHANTLGLMDKISKATKSKYDLGLKNHESRSRTEKIYMSDVIEAMSTKEIISLNDLREKYGRQYNYLLRNNKEWMYNNVIPFLDRKKKTTSSIKDDFYINLDMDLLVEIKNICKCILSNNEPIRITRSVLCKKTRKPLYSISYLSRLPQTKEYLDNICETIETFKMRKIDSICFGLKEKGEPLNKSKIKALLGRAYYNDDMESKINEIVRKEELQ